MHITHQGPGTKPGQVQIGKTFYIRSHPDLAVNNFIEDQTGQEYRNFLSDNFELIQRTFRDSCTGNLRALKQTLHDFSFIWESVICKYDTNLNRIPEFFEYFLALSLEYKSDSLKRENFDSDEYASVNLARRMADRSSNATNGKVFHPLELSENKFPNLVFGRSPLRIEIWKKIICETDYLSNEVKVAIDNSIFFKKAEDVPNWLALWNFWDLDSSLFDNVLNESIRRIEGEQISEGGEIIHIFALLAHFAENDVISGSRTSRFKEGEQYVGSLVAKQKLTAINNFGVHHFEKLGARFSNNGVTNSESQDTKDFIDFVLTQQHEVFIDNASSIAASLLTCMRNDITLFYRKLIAGHDETAFAEFPILTSVDCREFIDLLISMPTNDQKIVFEMFGKRYWHPEHAKHLLSEKGWLEKIKMGLTAKLSDLHVLDRHRVSQRMETKLEKAINQLQAVGSD